ncbi:DMT family transporter [Niveispirillum irakense]|uniref:DMT family transporter n=1 Tax=Niveispirillum irakense TaxID=34011 RepID=UPI000685D41B|nr:DMT family transporter [Niveispirillum irakense]
MPAPPSLPSGTVGRAIFSMICAVALFATMNAMVKYLGGRYPLGQMIFCRALFALIVLAPLIKRAGGVVSLGTRRPWGHAARSLIGVVAMFCGFTAITSLPLANAAAFAFTAPLWTTTLGVLVLGEKVRWRRTLALIVGFCGVLIMLRPDVKLLEDILNGGTVAVGSALALTSAALGACAMISVRRLSATEPSTTIVFYFMATGCLLSGLLTWPDFVMPDVKDGLLLILIGIIGGVAQLLLTTAYRGAPVAVIAPFDYTAMLWATGYGFLLWGEVPDLTLVLGAIIVVASGAYITIRETRLGIASTVSVKQSTKMG